MPLPTHSSRFYCPNNITCWEYKIKVLKTEATCSAETAVGYLSIKPLQHTTARTSYLKISEHHKVTKDRQLRSILVLLESIYKHVWHIPLLSVQLINCWWWTDELSETCRVSCQNKFVILVHFVGFIIKKFVTMHGHVNVKHRAHSVAQCLKVIQGLWCVVADRWKLLVCEMQLQRESDALTYINHNDIEHQYEMCL